MHQKHCRRESLAALALNLKPFVHRMNSPVHSRKGRACGGPRIFSKTGPQGRRWERFPACWKALLLLTSLESAATATLSGCSIVALIPWPCATRCGISFTLALCSPIASGLFSAREFLLPTARFPALGDRCQGSRQLAE